MFQNFQKSDCGFKLQIENIYIFKKKLQRLKKSLLLGGGLTQIIQNIGLE